MDATHAHMAPWAAVSWGVRARACVWCVCACYCVINVARVSAKVGVPKRQTSFLFGLCIKGW